MNDEIIESLYQRNINFDEIIEYDETTKKFNISQNPRINKVNSKLIIKNINFNTLHIMGNTYIYEKCPTQIIDNIIHDTNSIVFDRCIFNKRLKISQSLSKSLIFKNCKINEMILEDIQNTSSNDSQNNLGSIHFHITNKKSLDEFIKRLTIHHCIFNGKFYINNQKQINRKVKIDTVLIKESSFNENFKLHNCEITKIKIDGVDFKKNADFFKSKLGIENSNNNDIKFNGINFDKLVIFEECVFYNKFVLEYATFESLGQFRNATFKQGLDLDRTNILKDLNFYGIKELDEDNSKQNTSQETYKIVKYHSEKNGSVIQGNKYHALELEKKKEDLDKQKTITQERIVFWFNWTTSKFGTNWAYALGWMFIVGLISASIINYKDVINFYNIKPIYTMPLFQLDLLYEYTCKILTQIFTYVSIASVDNFKGHPIIFFFNKVALGYLYYQFVTAVRKDTRK